jgi:hypothetical protein
MTEKTKLQSGADVTHKELADAKKEGSLDYVKEGAKAAMIADTGTTADLDKMDDPEAKRVPADLNTTFIAPLLDMSADDLEKRLKSKDVNEVISLDVAKGLLALERAGKNRTKHVQVLCKAIGVKSPYEVTTAGPPYTNDETSVTNL